MNPLLRIATACLPLFLATPGSAQQNVTVAAVDPPDRLVGSVLGEWNTNGNLETWSGANVTGLAASGGIIGGDDASTTANASITLAPLANGPDLDLGFNDFLQIRLKLPAAYAGDVRIDYGTTTRTGFSSARRFVIPAASLIRDGQFHTYRLELGLEVFWRDFLRELRITPLLDTTGSFEIDYIEVGDVPGSAPALNLNTNFLSPLNATNTQRLESKHVCIWWDPNNTSFTLTHARRGLRMCEESYQVFCRKLGYNEPFRTFDSTTTERYKINFITWYDGFWAGGWNNRGHMNVGAGGLADEGWGNPVPHEFAHIVQMGQSGRMAGGHWESHANYLRAQRNLHFYDVIAGAIPAIDNLNGNSNYRPDHNRHIYADQRYYLSLDDYGTGFGLPANFTATVWRDGARDKTLIEKMAALLPTGVSVKDVACEALKYWPMLDFAEKTRIRQQHWGTTSNRLLHFWRQGAQLIPLQNQPGWWSVPQERAPDSWAYQMHVLDAAPGSTITTELRGIDKAGTGEDWRWCFAAISTGDNVRYSPVYPPGTQSFALNSNESQVFLIVTATPATNALDLDSFHNRKPVDKHADRRRFNYEVRLVNATPAPNRYAVANPSGFRIHANGGGVVGPSATVASTAYVGPNAKVIGSARVEANARIEDYAVVQGSAIVRGNAVVSGFAMVEGSALVEGDARIRDRAHVVSGAIRGRAMVAGYTRAENTTVTDDAIIRGCAAPFGGTISGTAILDHDYSMDFSFSDGNQFNHIPWGGWWNDYHAQNQRKPRGLTASYRTAEADGAEWWDEFGTLHARLHGSPARSNDSATASTILTFDGSDDHAVLCRSLCDTPRLTFAAWVRPASAPGTAQPILFMGRSSAQALRLERGASGQAVFSIGNGTTSVTLTGTSLLAANQWTHLAIQLDGSTARLFVNSIQEGSANTTLTPLSVLAPNDHASLQANYIARDWDGSLFPGAIEDARFFNVALSALEIRQEMYRRAAILGQFSPRTPSDFNGTSSTAQSGVPNGRIRTLSAWVRPRTSDDVSNYEAVFDSYDERSGSSGSGIGLDNGRWVVRLDGLGTWNTNVTATMNQWQHVALAFNGGSATLFINGSQAATRTYSGPSSDSNAAGKTYRIGHSQTAEATSSRQYFDGEILNARIYDRALTATQIPLDADGDGFNDPDEVAAGTDPLDPTSPAPLFQWDADPSAAGPQDGSGAWDASTANWIGNGINSVWSDAQDPVFGAGTDGNYPVTLAFSPSVTSLSFRNSGYILSASGAQTLTFTSTSAIGGVVIAAGKTTTIGSNLTLTPVIANSNYHLTGGGTLVIGNGATLRGSRSTSSANILYISGTTVSVEAGGLFVTNSTTSTQGTAIFVNGDLNVTGGKVDTKLGTLGIGQTADSPAGVLTLASGEVVAAGGNGVRIGSNSGTSPGGIVNLNGGTLSTQKIQKGTGTTVETSIVNLNGGILRKSASSSDPLIGTMDRVNLRNGGAVINTNGFAATITQPLEHSNHPGDAAIDGGLTKLGAGTLTLSAANSYTGPTNVSAGTLAVTGSSIPDSNRLVLNGGQISIAAGGNENIGTLFFGTVPQPPGTYGSSSSTAAFKDDSRFAGTGILTVTSSSAPADYEAWATASGLSPADRDPGNDPDGDGLTNRQEHAFGLDPKNGSSCSPVLVPFDPATRTFSYKRRRTSGLRYRIWTSVNLATWSEDTTALQTPTSIDTDTERVDVKLTSSGSIPPTELYVRVGAE